MSQISPIYRVKRNFATTAAAQQRVQRANRCKQRNRNMKPTWNPDARQQLKLQKNHLPNHKTGAPEAMDVDAWSSSEAFVVGPFPSDGFHWPPVEVPRRFRARTVGSTLPRRRSLKPHAVLGVKVPTGRRGSTGLRRLCRPVPFPLSRVPSSHLSAVMQALGITDPPAVGTPVRSPVPKIHSSDCSAFAAVDSTPSVTQGSDVSDVAEANTELLQKNVKLHPVLGIFVPTRRRS